MLGSKKINMINSSDIYHTYKGFYLSEKEPEENLPQVIQSENGLKVQAGVKTVSGTAIKLPVKENAIEDTFGKRTTIRFNFRLFQAFCILLWIK